MDSLKIRLRGETHEIKARPINLVLPSPSTLERISYEGKIVELTVQETTYHALRCSVAGWHKDTRPLLEYVFGTTDLRKLALT